MKVVNKPGAHDVLYTVLVAEQAAGVHAIVALQGYAHRYEPKDRARAGWEAMTPHQREQTLRAYEVLAATSQRHFIRGEVRSFQVWAAGHRDAYATASEFTMLPEDALLVMRAPTSL